MYTKVQCNYMFCGNMYQGSLYIKICLYKIEKEKFESQNKAQIQNIFSFQRQKYDYYTIHNFFICLNQNNGNFSSRDINKIRMRAIDC